MNKEITNALNGYIANIGVGYIKLHNLHWNVVGSQFKAVHEYLESLYDAFADVLDESAEILKICGEQPVASLKGYLAIATIKETAAVFRFTGLEKSTRFCTQMRTPSMPIMPYRTVPAPPRTARGIASMRAPNFGTIDRVSATHAAMMYAAVEYTRVAAMTPMFSA